VKGGERRGEEGRGGKGKGSEMGQRGQEDYAERGEVT
jgi:hypothetical protein